MTRLKIILVLLVLVASDLSRAEAGGQNMVTEQLIRSLYIEHPDSCLDMLDKARLRQLDTDMPLFQIIAVR